MGTRQLTGRPPPLQTPKSFRTRLGVHPPFGYAPPLLRIEELLLADGNEEARAARAEEVGRAGGAAAAEREEVPVEVKQEDGPRMSTRAAAGIVKQVLSPLWGGGGGAETPRGPFRSAGGATPAGPVWASVTKRFWQVSAGVIRRCGRCELQVWVGYRVTQTFQVLGYTPSAALLCPVPPFCGVICG